MKEELLGLQQSEGLDRYAVASQAHLIAEAGDAANLSLIDLSTYE